MRFSSSRVFFVASDKDADVCDKNRSSSKFGIRPVFAEHEDWQTDAAEKDPLGLKIKRQVFS